MGNLKRAAYDKASSSKRPNSSGDMERKAGCPVPLPTGCLKGFPLPESLEDGVKMVCSNTQCPFSEQYVHKQCFGALEENLTKIISNIGSARGWTDAQRRANLWDKKGLTLIQKKCRCPCGLGLMKIDDTAMFLANREAAVAAANAGPPKPRKAKSKNLPKLNFANNALSYASMKKQNLIQWPNSFGNPTHHLDIIYEQMSVPPSSQDPATEALAIAPINMNIVSGERAGWTQYHSMAPIPLHLDLRPFDSSSMVNSKIADGSVSYAQAISLKPMDIEIAGDLPEVPVQKVDASTESVEALEIVAANENTQKNEPARKNEVNEKVAANDCEYEDERIEVDKEEKAIDERKNADVDYKAEKKLDDKAEKKLHSTKTDGNAGRSARIRQPDLCEHHEKVEFEERPEENDGKTIEKQENTNECGFLQNCTLEAELDANMNVKNRTYAGAESNKKSGNPEKTKTTDMEREIRKAHKGDPAESQLKFERDYKKDPLKYERHSRWDQPRYERFNKWDRPRYTRSERVDYTKYAKSERWWNQPRYDRSEKCSHPKCEKPERWNQTTYERSERWNQSKFEKSDKWELAKYENIDKWNQTKFERTETKDVGLATEEDPFVDDGYGRFDPRSCFTGNCHSFDSCGPSGCFSVGEIGMSTDRKSGILEFETFSPKRNKLGCVGDPIIRHGVQVGNRHGSTLRNKNKMSTFSKTPGPVRKPNSGAPKMVDVAVQTKNEMESENDHDDEYDDGLYHLFTGRSFFLGERLFAEMFMPGGIF